jgi:hypothetical protein
MTDRQLLDQLYIVAKTAGCLCEFERTKSGVPIWFPIEGGGIGRKLIKRCGKCLAVEAYQFMFLVPA